jgi:hypothetical protein
MSKQTETILLIGGAALAVYFLTRPKTVLPPQQYTSPYGYNPYGQPQLPAGNTTSSIISAAGSAASGILNAISNF